MRTLALFFGWPSGGVWSNLLASAITGSAVWLWGRRHVRSLRRDVRELLDAHHGLATAHEATSTQVHELHLALIPPTKPPAE